MEPEPRTLNSRDAKCKTSTKNNLNLLEEFKVPGLSPAKSSQTSKISPFITSSTVQEEQMLDGFDRVCKNVALQENFTKTISMRK